MPIYAAVHALAKAISQLPNPAVLTQEIRPLLVQAGNALPIRWAGSGAKSLLLPGMVSFGAGMAVGFGAGLLTAPRSGKETRARVKNYVGGKVAALKRKDRDAAGEAAPAVGNGAERDDSDGGEPTRVTTN